MIKINKGKEPQKWKEYHQTKGAVYTPLWELREALAKEQGYICAFCMRRIEVDEETPTTTRISHILSRAKHPDKALDYRNMVLCCNGISQWRNPANPNEMQKIEHCDLAQGDIDLTCSPLNDAAMATIRYSSKDGAIRSTNDNWNRELADVLKLNEPLLMRNRYEVLHGVTDWLIKEGFNAANLQKIIEKHSEWTGTPPRRIPYCGVVISYAMQHLQQLNHSK